MQCPSGLPVCECRHLAGSVFSSLRSERTPDGVAACVCVCTRVYARVRACVQLSPLWEELSLLPVWGEKTSLQQEKASLGAMSVEVWGALQL